MAKTLSEQPVTPPSAESRVLILDRSREAVEVLQTALARRGVPAAGTSQIKQGLAWAQTTSPDLVVLNDDFFDDSSAPCTHWVDNQTPLVVLGKLRRTLPPACSAAELAKPYHYSALIRKIEELLRSERAA